MYGEDVWGVVMRGQPYLSNNDGVLLANGQMKLLSQQL